VKLRPVVNMADPPEGDMLAKLAVFEAVCNARGVDSVSVAYVKAFLTDEGRPDLAEQFNPAFLTGASQ
jgi:hypothetical protein